MIIRNWSKYENGVEIANGQHNITWEDLRAARDGELRSTDHHALSDRTMTDEMISYRVMLRDLPSDFEGENANQACDHWNDNPRPED